VFAKLVAVVLALGACGSGLLALRQSRLQVASELTAAQLRINAADERLWLLRARIAERVTPERIELMAADVGPLHPIAGSDATGFASVNAATELAPLATERSDPAKPRTPSGPREALPGRTPPSPSVGDAPTPKRTPAKPKGSAKPAGGPVKDRSKTAPPARLAKTEGRP